VAIRNAERALKILGAYGVAADHDTGRFLNDAWIGDACDGTHDLLRLSIVNFLRMTRAGQRAPGAGGPPPGDRGAPAGRSGPARERESTTSATLPHADASPLERLSRPVRP
jgi:hypothetical protein